MAQLPPVFVDLLKRSAAKRRRLVALRGAAEAGTVLVIGLAAAITIDVVLKPGESMRLVNSLGVGVLAAGILAVRGVRPLLKRQDEVTEARAIELDVQRAGVVGGDDDLLSSAVALSCQPTNGTAGWMVERTMALAGTRVLELNPLQHIDGSATRKSLVLCGSMLALALSTLVAPSMQQLWIRVVVPWSSAVRPGDLTFTIAPGNVQVVHGNRLGIEVSISEAVERADIELLWDDGASEIRPLHRDGSLWRLDLDALAVGASYRAVTGTNASPQFRIGLIHPPAIGEVSLTVTPPAYTGRPVAMMPAAGAVILAGSTVEVAVRLVGDPVSSATLVRFPGGEQSMTFGADSTEKAGKKSTTSGASTHAQAQFTAPHPGSEGRLALQLGIQLAGAGTPAVDTQKRWALVIVADRPPAVSLSGQGVTGGMVGRNEVIILEGKASDDEALREVFIEISAGDAPPLRRRLSVPGAGQSTISIPIDLADLGLSIGEGVIFHLGAQDNGGQTALSKPLQVVVADGDAAALSAMSDALRSAARKLADAVVTLGRLETDIANVVSRVNAQSPVAERTSIAVARQRAESVIRQVNDIAAKLPRQAAAPIGSACSAFGDDALIWSEQHGAILNNALAGMSGKNITLTEQAGFAAHEAQVSLRALAERLAVIAARAEAGRLEVRTAAAGPRVGRAATLLSGQQGWTTPVANQQPQAMASLPPAAVTHAQERFLVDGAVLAGVLPSVTNMADLLDQRGQPLRLLAAQAKAPADELNVLLQLPERDAKALQRCAVLAPVLATLAVQAREQLDQMLAERSSSKPPAVDALGRAKQHVDELRKRAESWHRQPDPQDPTASDAGTRELAAVTAGVRQVSVLLKDEQQRLLLRAQAPDATLAERRSALAERRMISSQAGPALVAVNRALTEVAKEPGKLRDRRAEVANSLTQLRDAISRVEPAAEGQRSAPTANAARSLLAAVPAKDSGVEDPFVAARAKALAAALRRQGDEERAKQVAEATESKRFRELAGQILKDEEKEEKRQLNLSEDLKKLSDSAQKDGAQNDEARAQLAGAALELHLAAEAARQDKHEDQAVAWERLSRDLSAELKREDGPRHAALADASIRASALEGRQGDPARANEIAQAHEAMKKEAVSPAVAADRAAAQELEKLNQRLDKAAQAADQRIAARAALESYAATTGLSPAARAQLDQAQELTDLATQVANARQSLTQARADQQAAAQEAAVQRQRFAELERSIAQRLAAAGQALATAAPTLAAPAPELANTLNGLQPKITERTAAVEKLAAQVSPSATAPAPESAATTPETSGAQAAALVATRLTATQAAALAQSAAARAEQLTTAQQATEEAALQRAQQLAGQVTAASQSLKSDSRAASQAQDAVGELAAATAQHTLANRATAAAAAADQLRALDPTDSTNESAIKTAAAVVKTAASALQQAAQEARQAASQAASQAVVVAPGNDSSLSAESAARAGELTQQAAHAEQLAAQLAQAGSAAQINPEGAAKDQAAAENSARLAAVRDAADHVAQTAELAAETATQRATEKFTQLGQDGGGDRADLAQAAKATQAALKEATAVAQSSEAAKASALTQAATAVARQATAEAAQARATAERATQETQPAIARATAQLAREQADQATSHAAAADALANAAAASAEQASSPAAPATPVSPLSPAAQHAASSSLAERAGAVAQATAAEAARVAESAWQADQQEKEWSKRAEDHTATPEARAAAHAQAVSAKESSKAADLREKWAKERADRAAKNAQDATTVATAAAAVAASAQPPAPGAPGAAADGAEAAAAAEQAAADAATHADAGLALASRHEAASMRNTLAQPLAQAWNAAALAKPGDPAVKQVGELGQEIARLAGEQEEAARLLEQSLKREESTRQRLARQLAAGESARSAIEDVLDTAAATPSATARSQVRSASAAAKQAQGAALQTWERAATATTAATRAAHTANAIRQGATTGDQQAADQQAAATAAQAAQLQNEAAGQTTQALASERAALAAATAAQATNPADSATTRSAAAGRLAALQTAAVQAADASRQQHAAAGPGADNANAAAQQATTSAAAVREALLSSTDGLGTAAERLAAQLDSAAEAARAASAQRTAEGNTALAPVVAQALGAAPAALVDTAVGRALAALAQAPDAEASFRQASATLATAANAARSAAALQNVGQEAAAAQTLASATAAAAKPGAPGAPGAPGNKPAQTGKPSSSGTSEGGTPAAPENGPLPIDTAPPGIDQAEWAKLSERVQQAIRSGGSERFAEEHQEAIRAYYRKLGEEK